MEIHVTREVGTLVEKLEIVIKQVFVKWVLLNFIMFCTY